MNTVFFIASALMLIPTYGWSAEVPPAAAPAQKTSAPKKKERTSAPEQTVKLGFLASLIDTTRAATIDTAETYFVRHAESNTLGSVYITGNERRNGAAEALNFVTGRMETNHFKDYTVRMSKILRLAATHSITLNQEDLDGALRRLDQREEDIKKARALLIKASARMAGSVQRSPGSRGDKKFSPAAPLLILDEANNDTPSPAHIEADLVSAPLRLRGAGDKVLATATPGFAGAGAGASNADDADDGELVAENQDSPENTTEEESADNGKGDGE